MHEGHRERMRRRLFEHGNSLTDHELFEILLYEHIPRKDTNPVAHALLDSFGDAEGVFSASPRLLCSVAGVGPRTAEYIYLVGRIFRRLRGGERKRVRLSGFGEVRSHVRRRFADVPVEKLEVYFTDADGFLLCTKSVTDVRRDKVALDSRLLGYILGEVHPAGVIVAHNHPSGSCEPSPEDDMAFTRLHGLCRMYGAALHDSLIYADGELFSYYRDERARLLGIEKEEW